MSKKKDLTDTELNAIASQIIPSEKEQTYIPQESTDVLRFIRDFNIRSGPNKIPNGLIFNTYLKWGGKKSLRGFFRHFKRHFKPYRTGDTRYYLLISTSFPKIDDIIQKEIINFNQLKQLQEQKDRALKEFAKKGMLEEKWKEIDTYKPRLPNNIRKRKNNDKKED